MSLVAALLPRLHEGHVWILELEHLLVIRIDRFLGEVVDLELGRHLLQRRYVLQLLLLFKHNTQK